MYMYMFYMCSVSHLSIVIYESHDDDVSVCWMDKLVFYGYFNNASAYLVIGQKE